MSRWNVKAPTLVILSCLVFIMLLIVVLPDVDLPDTAFIKVPHRYWCMPGPRLHLL